MLKEFKPALIFLGKFLGTYLILNFLYGFYIEHYRPAPDPVTRMVTNQSAACLRIVGVDASINDRPEKTAVSILKDGRAVVSVYEGCNGLNVLIIFLAFVVAYGGRWQRMLWFIPLGILTIHLLNLARIDLLFMVADQFPKYLYFTHKYLFTAFIYVGVFALWFGWVTKWNGKS